VKKEVWPNFFIVGACRGGTSSLHFYLRQHPQVFMPAWKEPCFFSPLRPFAEMAFPHPSVSDRAAYLRLFSKGAGCRAIGEASVSYLWDPGAPARIRAAVPDAKIVVSLRDPIERAYSHYLKDVREGWQGLPFYEALLEDWKRPEKGWGVAHLYTELGLYHRQVERYLDTFGPEQVLILLFEDLRTVEGRRRILAEVSRFLDLDPSYFDRIDSTSIKSQYAVPRWNWSRRFAGNWFVRRLTDLLVPARAGSTFRLQMLIYERFFVRRAAKPAMDERARDWLCAVYDDDLSATERLLGRRLPELRSSWDRASGDYAIRAAASDS